MHQPMSDTILKGLLSVAVYLRIEELKARGGPSPEEWRKLPETGKLLAEQGDKLLYPSAKKGETADLFNKTAQAIAILSYVPGGIVVFGMHFETKPEHN